MFKASGVAVCVIGVFVLRLDAQNGNAASGVQDEALPRNFAIESRLRDVIGDTFRASPTFRNQCRQLGRMRNVVVRIKVADSDPRNGKSRALTVLRRFESGLVIAEVTLISNENVSELVAHELEHVLEFTEGLNLRAESLGETPRVWSDSTGVYETRRATEIGHRVAEEVAKFRGPRSERN